MLVWSCGSADRTAHGYAAQHGAVSRARLAHSSCTSQAPLLGARRQQVSCKQLATSSKDVQHLLAGLSRQLAAQRLQRETPAEASCLQAGSSHWLAQVHGPAAACAPQPRLASSWLPRPCCKRDDVRQVHSCAKLSSATQQQVHSRIMQSPTDARAIEEQPACACFVVHKHQACSSPACLPKVRPSRTCSCRVRLPCAHKTRSQDAQLQPLKPASRQQVIWVTAMQRSSSCPELASR